MAILQHDSLTRWQEAFFLLLRCGLWEQAPDCQALFPLSDDEWQAVYDEARRQAVQGLLYRGFQQLPIPFFPPQALVMRWVADADVVEQTYHQSLRATTQSWQLLCQSGQQPLLQKGLAVGLLYEHPEERVYGDVDWYVGDMAAAKTLLEQRGIKTEHAADRSMSFTMDGVQIELHPQLIDMQQRRPSDRSADEATTMELALPDGTHIATPAPLPTLLMLEAHILKHVVTVGIGLRQFCDLARAYHALYRQADGSRLADSYRRLGLERWTQLSQTFLHQYLGTPLEELPTQRLASDKACRRLARAILRWGNFGQHTQAWQTAAVHHHTKWHTIRQIACNLPFALRYAPSNTLRHIGMLVRNQ